MEVPASSLRQQYMEELQMLEHDLLEMGSRVEAMSAHAVEALSQINTAKAMQVIQSDDDIDERDLAIETRCLKLLALQQPMAGDLRVIGTAMKMITDLERVGDLAVDIAKITLKIEREMGRADTVDIPRMATVARAMLRTSLEAYVKRDMAIVEQVCVQDDDVDALYRELREELFDDMREHPENVVSDSWLLLAIHHVERIADHAVNIAERVAFMVTGELKHPSAAQDQKEV